MAEALTKRAIEGSNPQILGYPRFIALSKDPVNLVVFLRTYSNMAYPWKYLFVCQR